MNSETGSGNETTTNKQINADIDTADRGIIPAETAARREREGSGFKEESEQTAPDSIDTTGGATVDKEGLANNYAIEPEMYVNEPGDLRQQEEELSGERGQELKDVNQDEEGKLNTEGDKRGKGPGII